MAASVVCCCCGLFVVALCRVSDTVCCRCCCRWPCVTQLAHVVGNDEAVRRMQVIAEQGNMPNLILAVRLFSVVCS